MKWKAFFVIYKGRSIVRNFLRPESGPLRVEGSGNEIWNISTKISVFSVMNASSFVKFEIWTPYTCPNN